MLPALVALMVLVVLSFAVLAAWGLTRVLRAETGVGRTPSGSPARGR